MQYFLNEGDTAVCKEVVDCQTTDLWSSVCTIRESKMNWIMMNNITLYFLIYWNFALVSLVFFRT